MTMKDVQPNERLRQAREDRRWTQEDLAEQLETDFETVSRWERGETIPRSYFRRKLCKLFSMTAEELGLVPDLNNPLVLPPSPYLVLASPHKNAEYEQVIQLKELLTDRGIPVLYSRTLRRYSHEQRRRAVRSSQGVLVIISPDACSSIYVQDALDVARMYSGLVCAVWVEGEEWQDCTPKNLGIPHITIDARQGLHADALDQIKVMLNENARNTSEAAATSRPPLPSEPRNPYKGLHAFHREDEQDFFGREILINELVTDLQVTLTSTYAITAPRARLLAILGPSGSGKSSVVMAGLLPYLQAGALANSKEWIYLAPTTPGIHPMESLARTFRKQSSERNLSAIREALDADSNLSLHLLAQELIQRQEQRVLLYIDQFEELFSQANDEEERQQFIELLLTAITRPHGPLVVVLTLRADFYDHLTRYPQLATLVREHHRLVLPMDNHDLRTVIERPATLDDVQVTFEENLVGDILFDLYGQIGVLPLLQFTLDQLFQHRTEHVLTQQAYQEIGGVKGAIARHAEATYEALPSQSHRTLTRVLFERLITLGASEQEAIRRRTYMDELVLSNNRQTAILRETMESFISKHLLVTSKFGEKTTIELSHEALIGAWPRLSEWLRAGREDIVIRQIINQDATEWERHNKHKDRLYRGSQLKEAKAWARRNEPNQQEFIFLQAASKRRRVQFTLNICLALALLLSALGIGNWLFPNTNLVTTLEDTGNRGSLRWAIEKAPADSTITFAPNVSSLIKLKRDLVFSKNLIIQGPEKRTLAISSGSNGFIITILAGITVTFRNLTFKDSNIKTTESSIATSFIMNFGRLFLEDSTVTGNSAQASMSDVCNGGGITNHGELTLNKSTVSHNTTSASISSNTVTTTDFCFAGSGGGIASDSVLNINNSRIEYNKALGMIAGSSSYASCGGGVFITTSATLNMEGSRVSNNEALASHGADGIDRGTGGGICISGANTSQAVTLTRSIIAQNIAQGGDEGGRGGGIYLDGRSLHLTNDSGVSENRAGAGSHATSALTSSRGGGIFAINTTDINLTPTITLANSKVSKNEAEGTNRQAGSEGGGIGVVGYKLNLTGSQISDNRVSGGSNGDEGSNSSGGGGIFISGTPILEKYVPSQLMLNRCLIARNSAENFGGGILDQGSQMDINNTIIIGNTATHGGGIAIEDNNAELSSASKLYRISNSQVMDNRAPIGSNIWPL